MTTPDAPARLLSWDTDFFSARIARVNLTTLTPEALTDLETWSQHNQVDCLYLLLDIKDTQSATLAEASGFHLRDVRMTFNCKRPQTLPDIDTTHFREATDDDLPHLREIASGAYTMTRFYHDPCFSRDHCDRLYDTWLVKSLQTDLADAVLIAEHNGVPAGFMTAVIHGDTGIGQIGLVGVAAAARGQGIGRRMMHYTLNWFWQREIQQVRIVTQARNIAAQRLYQACDFRTQQVELWYHRWLTDCTDR